MFLRCLEIREREIELEKWGMGARIPAPIHGKEDRPGKAAEVQGSDSTAPPLRMLPLQDVTLTVLHLAVPSISLSLNFPDSIMEPSRSKDAQDDSCPPRNHSTTEAKPARTAKGKDREVTELGTE